MKESRPVLSISLLSSGRAKTIQKCLDSLVPLMKKVDSELIIVDTGCNEEIKQLMSGYTDKIIPFTWCDDFSAARNAGLNQARGEWFMYIDDDEWFIDTKEIEDFFLSGEYKKYYYACYTVRNYTTLNGDIYTDAWASRLVRREKNVHFVSTIHEYFYPLYDPYKLLHSIAEHYGYIYSTRDEEKAHIKRNILLLTKMIKREKNTIRWWTHLLQEYRAGDEYSQMQKLCREGLEHFRNRNDYDTNRDRGAFYCGMAEAELLSAYYEQAETDINKALTDKRNTQMCQMRLYNLGAEAYFKQGKYDEAEKYCEKYLEFYELLKDNETERQRQGCFFVRNAFEMSGRNSALCFYILCGLYRGDTTALKQYFGEFDWNGVLMLYRGFINDVIDAMAAVPYDEELVRAAEMMTNRKNFHELWDKLSEIEANARNSEADTEKFYRIARIFSQAKASNHYVWYLRILYSDHAAVQEDWDLCYENMFRYVTDIFELNDEVFSIAEKHQVNLGLQFEKLSFDRWKKGVDSFFSHNTYGKLLQRAELIERTALREPDGAMRPGLSVRYDYFFVKMAAAEIASGIHNGDFTDLQKQIRQFVEKSLAFYSKFYKENAFHGEMELLTPDCRAAVKFYDLLQAQERGNRTEIGDCLKAVVGVYPPFDMAVKAYTKLFAEEENAKLAAASVSPEMRALGEQIKGKLRILLEQNMIAEAQQVYDQLKQLLPDDRELDKLGEEIRKHFF